MADLQALRVIFGCLPTHSGLFRFPTEVSLRRSKMPKLRLFLPVPAMCLLGCLLGAIPVHGIEPSVDCKNAQTTADMRACENARYEKAEQELNMVYENLMQKLDSGQQEKLRVAQRAWLKFRDANADFMADAARGGTLEPLIRTSVLADMTAARAAELRKQLEK